MTGILYHEQEDSSKLSYILFSHHTYWQFRLCADKVQTDQTNVWRV